MLHLDNISITSSMEDEFAEWPREFSWTFGKSYAWVKKASNQCHPPVILHWCTSLSNSEVTVIQAFPEEIKAAIQKHWVQFENIEIQDMKWEH